MQLKAVVGIASLGLLAVGCFLGGVEAQLVAQVPPNCGVASLIQLLDLLDHPLNFGGRWIGDGNGGLIGRFANEDGRGGSRTAPP